MAVCKALDCAFVAFLFFFDTSSLMAVCKALDCAFVAFLFFFWLFVWDNALHDDAVVVSLHI